MNSIINLTEKEIIGNEIKAEKLIKKGQIDEAISLYEKNLMTGIYSDKTCRGLYYLYRKQGMPDKAMETINRIIEICKKNNNNDDSLTIWERELQFAKKYSKQQPLYEKSKLAHSYTDIDNISEMELKLTYPKRIKKAIKLYEETIENNINIQEPYYFLMDEYHFQKDLENEKRVLELYIKNIDSNSYYINRRLENVESFLKTGEWKYDFGMPIDKLINIKSHKIAKAKKLLKEGNKKECIKILEETIEDKTYINTAYYTLYQIYKKDKQYDDAIKVCDKAIENLGFFSKERFNRWTEIKNKTIVKIENGN